MVSFFSENYYKYHYSNSCSLAYIFMVVLILFVILLPFFTNFAPLDKFWLPNTIFTDHPIVQFNDEFFIELTFDDFSTARFYPSHLIDGDWLLSSSNFEAQDYSNKDIINVIKYKGHIQFVGATNTNQIKSVKFFIFFDYYMTELVNIHLRSKAHLFYSSDDTFSKIISETDLTLKQNKAMTETYFIQEPNSAQSLNEEINEVMVDPFNKDIDNYFILNKNYNFVYKENNPNSLDLDITINIPYYQDIIVKLPNYTNIKNKWVLYSILFFPTLFVCYWLMGIAISNGIFKTRIKSDIPLKM